jgi:hypothetical protein
MGGAPTKKAPAAAKASTAPIKASEATARGVSKPSTKGVEDNLTLPELLNPKLTTTKVNPKKNTKVIALAYAPASAPLEELKTKKKPALEIKADVKKIYLTQLLNPPNGPFKNFMDRIKEVLQGLQIQFNPKTCITGISRQDVFNYVDFYNRPPYTNLRVSLGGSNNKTKSNNNLSKKNNHTRRNKNKRKKNTKNKTKFKPKSSSKYKKVIPSSRYGSQSNRKKSKPKKSQKNVTFKRRRARK